MVVSIPIGGLAFVRAETGMRLIALDNRAGRFFRCRCAEVIERKLRAIRRIVHLFQVRLLFVEMFRLGVAREQDVGRHVEKDFEMSRNVAPDPLPHFVIHRDRGDNHEQAL